MDRARSGRSLGKRLEFKRLREDILAGKIKRLFVCKFDRLGRATKIHVLVEDFEKCGCEVVSCTEGHEDSNHAVVSSDDAIDWAPQLAKEDPDELTIRLLKAEPAAFGLGANIAKRTCEYLAKNGVSESLVAFVFSQICCAGALSIEIMRLGSAKLFEAYLAERDGKDSHD